MSLINYGDLADGDEDDDGFLIYADADAAAVADADANDAGKRHSLAFNLPLHPAYSMMMVLQLL